MIINNKEYNVLAVKNNLNIVQDCESKTFGLYNTASKRIEINGYDSLSFAYTTHLLSENLKPYSSDQLTILQATQNKKQGVICITRENGFDVSCVSNPIPIEYDMVHITSRGDNKDASSVNYNENCIVYTGNNGKKGLYIFSPQNTQIGNEKSILKGKIPCIFDEIYEYYPSNNLYFKWWKQQEAPSSHLFYVCTNKKCGVYDAISGKFEVAPNFDQVSPYNTLTGYKASYKNAKYVIIDGEEYISTNSLISKLIVKNERDKQSELTALLHHQDNVEFNK